mgnify:CR=1 FL=1
MKRRNPEAKESRSPDAEALETFVRGADNDDQSPKNPYAPRNFKALRLPFNEYEWGRLEAGCRMSGRSKLNLLRVAMLAFVDDTELDQQRKR